MIIAFLESCLLDIVKLLDDFLGLRSNKVFDFFYTVLKFSKEFHSKDEGRNIHRTKVLAKYKDALVDQIFLWHSCFYDSRHDLETLDDVGSVEFMRCEMSEQSGKQHLKPRIVIVAICF